MKIKNIFIEGAIPIEKIAQSISTHSSNTNIGGHSIFLGQVRKDNIHGKNVISIVYTAFQEMALIKIAEIREQIFEKYDLECLHIYHSLGLVNIGEICLFVFTSSKHRKMAIDSCEEIVEHIKKDVPIWGKEIFEDNDFHWKENQ